MLDARYSVNSWCNVGVVACMEMVLSWRETAVKLRSKANVTTRAAVHGPSYIAGVYDLDFTPSVFNIDAYFTRDLKLPSTAPRSSLVRRSMPNGGQAMYTQLERGRSTVPRKLYQGNMKVRFTG